MPARMPSCAVRRARHVSTALLLALSSTACQQARPVLVQRQVPAELVRPCPAEPERPAFVDDRDLFVWLSRTLQAGAECRAAHAALAEWATSAAVP